MNTNYEVRALFPALSGVELRQGQPSFETIGGKLEVSACEPVHRAHTGGIHRRERWMSLVNVVLADVPPLERLADWRIRHNQTAFVIFVDGADEDDSLDALYARARAILPRTAKPDEIITAIKAVTNGLADLPSELHPAVLSVASLVGAVLDDKDPD